MGSPGESASPTTRERILASARELFAQDGYNRATVRAIGRRSGITDAAIYHHFRGKRALYDAVLEERPVPPRGPEDEGASRQALLAMIISAMEAWARQPGLTALMFHQGIAGDGQTVEANVVAREEIIAMVEPCLQGGGSALAAEALAYVVSGMVTDAILRVGAAYPELALGADGLRHVAEAIDHILPAQALPAQQSAAG
ncbi:MAG TPA: helix-turn-helix domain-containing protein [Tepidiformaceae bacterium]|nr:helix-turn-helix domain-containing protein [Tepidiformaceae bacterium]